MNNFEFAISNVDISSAGSNALRALGVGVASGCVTGLVNYGLTKVAKKVLNIQNQRIYTGIKVIAFAAGVGTALCLSPQVALVEFTARQVFDFFALSIAANIFTMAILGTSTPTVFFEGSALGLAKAAFGTGPVLGCIGALGAGLATIQMSLDD
ncbi:MAG: hypothetical protein ACXU9U_00170 [Parachlamydiaceae bacterium]